jgi:hypothetical protein
MHERGATMAFETYQRRSRPVTGEAIMAVQKRGTISLNSVAYRMLGGREEAEQADTKGDKTVLYVELLFDPEKRAVGLRAVPPQSANSYPVRKMRRAQTYLMTAKGFLTYYRIPVGEHRTYTATELAPGVIGFTLREDDKDQE